MVVLTFKVKWREKEKKFVGEAEGFHGKVFVSGSNWKELLLQMQKIRSSQGGDCILRIIYPTFEDTIYTWKDITTLFH